MESKLPASVQPAETTHFAVLLFSDIVGSTDLKARHGVPAYSEALRTHNGFFERIARECRSIRILQNMGDGYFAEAGGVAEAVKFALLFQHAMREEPWGKVRLTTRVGVHAGEVGVVDSAGGCGVVGPAADLAARVMSLAVGGQILLTRFPFDEARHFIREHPTVAGCEMPPLCWLAHGPYLLKGRAEPMEIFEVGAEGLAPLVAPPDGEKAKRAIRPGEEETLGWRPAIGLEIPGRIGWHLTEQLGAGGFGEVWTGEHARLHQRRAFKFCFDDERLRALKREVTLVRLLRSALGDRDDIVHIHELKLDAPPFYLESDLAPHGNLLQWAERQGGLDKIPLAQRIALVAHTATALAAAHSIGVLHKDIKPTNILIFDGPGGEPRPRLVDFGIGTLADHAVLREFGVTAAGFTRATIQHSTGTPTYSPPEYLAGKPFTIQGDIYGLGVLLYQLITARPHDPLAAGWERDIADPLLREDIAACVDGDPARRFPSGADLAERLLHLDQRRAEIVEKERLVREAAAHAEADATALADRVLASRLRKLSTAFAFIALLVACGTFVAYERLSFRQTMARTLTVLADTLARTSRAAISFDQKDAEETLQALGAEPTVIAACLYSSDGAQFAGYARPGAKQDFPARAGQDGIRFEHDFMVVVRPVTLEDKRIGTIYLRADLAVLDARLRLYAGISGLVLLGSFLLAFALSDALQRVIRLSRRIRNAYRRRFPSSAEPAERRRQLEQRRAEIVEKNRLARETATRAESDAGALTDRVRAARLRKLTATFALIALLVACGTLFAYVRVTFRSSMVRNLTVLADAVALNSFSALLDAALVDTTQGAEESLAVLGADPAVVAACLYTDKGLLYATYTRAGTEEAEKAFPAKPEPDGTRFQDDFIVVVRPVTNGTSQRSGTIYLRADLAGLNAQLRAYAGISGLVLFGSFLLALAPDALQWVITRSRRIRNAHRRL